MIGVRTVESYMTHKKVRKNISKYGIDACNSRVFCGTCLFNGACDEVQSYEDDKETEILLNA